MSTLIRQLDGEYAAAPNALWKTADGSLSVCYLAEADELRINLHTSGPVPAQMSRDVVAHIQQHPRFKIIDPTKVRMIGIVQRGDHDWCTLADVVIPDGDDVVEVEMPRTHDWSETHLVARNAEGQNIVLGTPSVTGGVLVHDPHALEAAVAYGNRHNVEVESIDTGMRGVTGIVGRPGSYRVWEPGLTPDLKIRDHNFYWCNTTVAWNIDGEIRLLSNRRGTWSLIALANKPEWSVEECLLLTRELIERKYVKHDEIMNIGRINMPFLPFPKVVRHDGDIHSLMDVMKEASTFSEQGYAATHYIAPTGEEMVIGRRSYADGTTSEIIVTVGPPRYTLHEADAVVLLPIDRGLPLTFIAQALTVMRAPKGTNLILSHGADGYFDPGLPAAIEQFRKRAFGLTWKDSLPAAPASGVDTTVAVKSRTYAFDEHGDLAWFRDKTTAGLIRHDVATFEDFHRQCREADIKIDHRHLQVNVLPNAVATKNSIEVRARHPLDDAEFDTVAGRIVCRRSADTGPIKGSNQFGWRIVARQAFCGEDIDVATAVIDNGTIAINKPTGAVMPDGVKEVIESFSGVYVAPILEITQMPLARSSQKRFKLRAEDLPALKAVTELPVPGESMAWHQKDARWQLLDGDAIIATYRLADGMCEVAAGDYNRLGAALPVLTNHLAAV